MLVKDLTSNRVDEGVSNPSAVVTSSDFAELVSSDLGHGDLVGLGVVLDRDLSRHATHSGDFTPEIW